MSDEHTERDGWRCYDDPYYRRAERHQTVVSVEDDGWIEVAAEEGSGYQRESIRTFLPPSVVDWLVAERIMGIATGIIALGEWARRAAERQNWRRGCPFCNGHGNLHFVTCLRPTGAT